MYITVKVKAKHIKTGLRNDSRACLIALALRDIGNQYSVSYHGLYNAFTKRAEMTKKGIKFASEFDVGKKVKPTTFKFKVL